VFTLRTTSYNIGRRRTMSYDVGLRCRPTSYDKASSAVVRCRTQCEHRYTHF